MVNFIKVFPNPEIVATLSQTLSWSHFVELVSIDDTTKRFFYQQMCLTEFWSIRALRQKEDAIVSQLEDFILELGQGFAFLERQKRISIDSIDYYLDMLFYHRKLNRLIAIDLKLGKFKPEYKGQMELYLKYLQKYDKQPHENTPIGLLLCSEGNTEHVEILLLGEENIKVAQYLTALPDKQWFIEKLNKAITVAQQNAKLD